MVESPDVGVLAPRMAENEPVWAVVDVAVVPFGVQPDSPLSNPPFTIVGVPPAAVNVTV
jgi:hypothetical protein